MLLAIDRHRQVEKSMTSTAETYTQAPNLREACFGTQVLARRSGVARAAEFEDQELHPEPGLEVLIYSHIEGKFMKQAARIDAVLASVKRDIRFELTGEPVSAESRDCYRVSTVLTDLTAKLGTEEGCPLLDVSATGFGVAATGRYHIREVVTAPKVTSRSSTSPNRKTHRWWRATK